ncbi:pentatricopeptide repeat-containing protein At2g01390-like [Ricinus communis]|uniref:pentatricopeptide repeat-containing protein At2g01390-like n=1 Tax=Ricinus communis TaxID=3988 RepID=UPI00201B01FB|nr:pentatricopeptide repeat-containing protein At2g01390-like [Ricinus communis]
MVKLLEMVHLSGISRFLVNSLISSSICKDLFFHDFNTSKKCIHSLLQSKPTKSTKFSTKPPKSVLNKDKIQNPNVYTRNTVSNIYRILKYSTWETAKEQILKLGIKWDSYTVNQVLKTHPPMEKAWIFFNWVSGFQGFKHDQFTYTTMLDIFGEAGRIESMNYVFKQMQEKDIKIDTVTYTSLMHWLSRNGDVDGAIKIWEEMKEKGLYLTVVSYTAFMKILFDNKRVKEATNIYKEMLECGIPPNCHTYTVLMEYLVVSGKCQEALEIFKKMQEAGVQPDKAMCNILVERCCEAGETKTMTPILQYMKENHLALRYPIFLEARKILRIAGECDAVLRQVNPHCAAESINNDDSSEFTTSADNDPIDKGLLLILLRKQNLVAVDHLLAGVLDKNMVLESWIVSTIIEVNCSQCRTDSALMAFEYSMRVGIDLERTAYLALIGIMIRSNTSLRVLEIVKETIRVGHSLGLYLSALLIYRLGSARRPNCAAKIFDLLPDEQKCTATYTAMIGVYFSAGSAAKALKIYKTMKKNSINPSLGTYNVLLAGLEKSGRVCETDNFRKEKRSLMADGNRLSCLPMEEKICDLLFAGSLVP